MANHSGNDDQTEVVVIYDQGEVTVIDPNDIYVPPFEREERNEDS